MNLFVHPETFAPVRVDHGMSAIGNFDVFQPKPDLAVPRSLPRMGVVLEPPAPISPLKQPVSPLASLMVLGIVIAIGMALLSVVRLA